MQIDPRTRLFYAPVAAWISGDPGASPKTTSPMPTCRHRRYERSVRSNDRRDGAGTVSWEAATSDGQVAQTWPSSWWVAIQFRAVAR